jgi:hypothetical protein
MRGSTLVTDFVKANGLEQVTLGRGRGYAITITSKGQRLELPVKSGRCFCSRPESCPKAVK